MRLHAIYPNFPYPAFARSHSFRRWLVGVVAIIAVPVVVALWAMRGIPDAAGSVAPAVTSKGIPVQDCGPRALRIAAKEIRVASSLSLAQITRTANVGRDGASMAGMVTAANAIGLTATGVQMDADALTSLKTPALAWVDGNHFVAVLRVSTDFAGVTSALIHDPNKPEAEIMTVPELLRRSGGVLLLLEKSAPMKGGR